MYLKVCGLREADNVASVINLMPQWVGFIFVPSSPRYFYGTGKPASLAAIEAPVKKVGVFVNDTVDNILHLQKLHQLDFVQLHGDETVEQCKLLKGKKLRIIKAFSIHDAFHFSEVDRYCNVIDLLLFDTAGKLRGGNGTAFNWQLLNGRRFGRPFLLSGGIGPEDVARLKQFKHPDMIGVDVNSCFETEPGIKDIVLLKAFKQQISQA